MRGVTYNSFVGGDISLISTHTPHARRDVATPQRHWEIIFLLTRLMRGVTYKIIGTALMVEHFYSHASCEA